MANLGRSAFGKSIDLRDLKSDNTLENCRYDWSINQFKYKRLIRLVLIRLQYTMKLVPIHFQFTSTHISTFFMHELESSKRILKILPTLFRGCLSFFLHLGRSQPFFNLAFLIDQDMFALHFTFLFQVSATVPLRQTNKTKMIPFGYMEKVANSVVIKQCRDQMIKEILSICSSYVELKCIIISHYTWFYG